MGISETMKALADPVRREILEMLKKGPKSAGEIAQAFDLTGATVSYHLSQLKKAGLIYEERQKNFIYYYLDATVFEEILVWLAAFAGGKNNEIEK
ncbi:autorepressor SdpR family transcription factor [Streptococcus massiliensis]|uniref:Arsenical resistance operon repressor ArsR n=1 Tax=Streptococcus massiliensis TaxID=313439 RepID=A0A380KXX8_9STRE|nr:autorepressor SdpR family transcription factor [Streptococcus massiliensis]SUN76823.1 arsenical resistance operon repressor ArsR [Streptococcus massiliensis]